MIRFAAVCVVSSLVVGCGGAPPRPAAPAPTEDGIAVGTWQTADGSASETWVEVGPTQVGVGFAVGGGVTKWFEVMVVRGDGPRTLTAMPGGGAQVDFVAPQPGAAFANPEHDDPTSLRYVHGADELRAHIDGARGPRVVTMQRVDDAPATALVEADSAFADDSAARGGAAWAARFESEGANWPIGGARVRGPQAIQIHIDSLVARGLSLAWTPTASGLSAPGDAGFTAGTYQVLRTDTGEVVGTGVYVTVWRRQADGTWKIAFDTGLADD